MPDLIGEIGLDTNQIENALEGVTRRLLQMSVGAGAAGMALTGGLVAAVGLATKGMIEAAKATREFNEQLDKIVNTRNVGSRNTTVAQLNKDLEETKKLIADLTRERGFFETQFETLNEQERNKPGENYNDAARRVAAQREEQLNKLLKTQEEIQTKITEKKKEANEILQREANGEKDIVELKKLQLEYDEKSAEIAATSNVELAKQLKLERDILETKINQRDPNYKRQPAIRDWDAEGNKAEGQTNLELLNKDTQDFKDQLREQDREFADERRQQMKDQQMSEREEGDANYAAAETQRMDNLREMNQRRDEEAKRRDEMLRDMARRNAENFRREEITADIGDVGRGTYQDELSIRQDFNERRKRYIEDHNDEALKQLDRQEAQALQGVRAAQNRETPASRRAERTAEQREITDSAQQDRRDQELRDRAARGATSRDIEELKEKDKVKSKMDADQKAAEKAAKQEQGWTRGDADNLKSIADALKAED